MQLQVAFYLYFKNLQQTIISKQSLFWIYFSDNQLYRYEEMTFSSANWLNAH